MTLQLQDGRRTRLHELARRVRRRRGFVHDPQHASDAAADRIREYDLAGDDEFDEFVDLEPQIPLFLQRHELELTL